jgi:hypothetical protein
MTRARSPLPDTKIFCLTANTNAPLQNRTHHFRTVNGGHTQHDAHLRLSIAIELGQLGTGCWMLTRSPAVGPRAEKHSS